VEPDGDEEQPKRWLPANGCVFHVKVTNYRFVEAMPSRRRCGDDSDRHWGEDGRLALEVQASFVNLLTIHSDFFGGADANAHLVSPDIHHNQADIISYNDLFADFSS
jgi:hypothetical protein